MSGATELPKLGARELGALAEIAEHQDPQWGKVSPYWWKPAAMTKLAAHGLVERDGRYGSDANPAWVITAAGRRRVAPSEAVP